MSSPDCTPVVYRAVSTSTGKIYVGATTLTLERRQFFHKLAVSNGSERRFHCAIRDLGWEDFTWQILEYAELDDLHVVEAKWIALLRSYPDGYNMTPHGSGCYSPGRIHTEETRKKMSAAHLGRKNSAQAIAKTAAANKGNKYCLGYKHSAETNAKKAAAMMGNKNSLGYKQSPEHIAKAVAGRAAARARKLAERGEES